MTVLLSERFPIPDSRFPIPDSRFPTPDSRFPTPDSRPVDDSPNTDVIQGTLDMLILKTLSLQPLHGFGIARRIEQVSRGVFKVNPGSLLTALQRLERAGWLDAEWRQTENSRKAKFYALTRAGRTQLEQELTQWERLSAAIQLALRNA